MSLQVINHAVLMQGNDLIRLDSVGEPITTRLKIGSLPDTLWQVADCRSSVVQGLRMTAKRVPESPLRLNKSLQLMERFIFF